VLLKRGISATVQELLLSAEYLLAEGNHDVILCERGVRSSDTATRNLFDLTAIPVVHKLSALRSSRTIARYGMRDKVSRWLGRRWPPAPTDHGGGPPNPEEALSDGAQSLYPDQFSQLMREVRLLPRHWPTRRGAGGGWGRDRRLGRLGGWAV